MEPRWWHDLAYGILSRAFISELRLVPKAKWTCPVSLQDDDSDGFHPRQQRREAQQRAKKKAFLLAQEQQVAQQRQAANAGLNRSLDSRLPPKNASRPEPLQDVTTQETNGGHLANADHGRR